MSHKNKRTLQKLETVSFILMGKKKKGKRERKRERGG